MSTRTGRFRRSDRLRRSWEFQRVGRQGERRASRYFVLLSETTAGRGTREGASGRRLGVTVSRRVGNAVVRNRVKRGVREWFRTVRNGLEADRDFVVIARRPASELRGGEMRKVLDVLAATPSTRSARSAR